MVFQLNNDQLKQFYEKCQKDKLIAIDTEFYRVDTYFPKLCLIQLSNSSECLFLDPIKQNLDLTYLRKILFNTKITKIFHAARQDVEIIFNLFKKIPSPIMDTQICLIALGYPHSTSYAKACEDFLNISINKSNQFIDWRKRPLNKKEILYALNDVKYLIPLFKKISSKLDDKKKKELKIHYQKITDIKIYKERAKKAWKKIRFFPKDNFELSRLKKYSRIRENLAMKKNIPVRRVISDQEIKIISRNTVNKKIKSDIIKKLDIKNI